MTKKHAGITINGKPLEEVLRKSRRTSSARSGNGHTIFSRAAGQPETHVIVVGTMFPWEEKAPYVRSGHSILGAIEYSEKLQKVKCHDCGGWFVSIAHHINAHGITSREYRSEHGLRRRTKLHGPTFLFKNRHTNHNRNTIRIRTVQPKGVVASRAINRIRVRMEGCAETANLRHRCKAQLTTRIQTLYQSLRRTPTAKELFAAGIYHSTIEYAFSTKLPNVLASLGIPPNRSGISVTRKNRIA